MKKLLILILMLGGTAQAQFHGGEPPSPIVYCNCMPDFNSANTRWALMGTPGTFNPGRHTGTVWDVGHTFWRTWEFTRSSTGSVSELSMQGGGTYSYMCALTGACGHKSYATATDD